MPEIRNCPFCRFSNVRIKHHNLATWFVYCTNCHCDGPYAPDMQTAIDRWGNGHQDADGALENIRELRLALAMIREAVEFLGPVGAVNNDEYIEPPAMLEAEAIIVGIMKMSDAL